MTAEQIEEKIDDISHYVGYIGEQKVRFLHLIMEMCLYHTVILTNL